MEQKCKYCLFSNLFSAILFIISFSLKAQPANDDIASAVTLAVNSNNCTSGTNVAATTAAGDITGSCWVGGTRSHTVWYKFVAPSSGNVAISTDHSGGGTLADPQLAVFSSSNGASTGTLTQMVCNDDITPGSNTQSTVTLTDLTAGNTYFIELDGYSTNTGTFCIDVHDGGSILTNDDCSNAMNLWVGASCNYQMECTYTNYPSPTTDATDEAWETAPASWSQGEELNTVWFKFTALATSTRIQIPTNDGTSTTDPHVGIYSGSCGSLTLVASQEDLAGGGGPGSTNRGVDLTFATTIDDVYYIQYDSDDVTGCNNICLSSADGLSTPANNDCASATALTLNTPVNGNNWLSSADGTFSCGETDNSVWYKYTAASTAAHYFSITDQTGCSSENNSSSLHTNLYAANLQMTVYNTASCTPTSANEMDCADYINTNTLEVSANLTSGNTYLILVDGLGGASCGFSMRAATISILPIRLLSFEGENQGNINLIKWTTVSEINNNYFTVERSEDAVNYITLDTIKGATNSNEYLSYSFIDVNPIKGIGYYRLTQTDNDGKISYPSKIIAIDYSDQRSVFNVYPNPSDGKSIILEIKEFPEKEILIVVTNALGLTYYSKIVQLNKNGESIEIIDPYHNLPAGIYLIKASSKSQLYSQKIIIQ